MNVKFIDVAGTNVPNIPFVWYREEQILPTFEFCKFIDKDIFIDICNRIELDVSNLDLNDNTEFSISIQRHILSDVNLYISYHGYIYNKMTDDPNDDIVLDSKYNRDHRFSVKTITNNENVDFLHLSRDATVTGSVYIHDSAFSPPGNFHFRKTTDDTVYLVTEASCRDIPNQKIVSLFVIMNDKLKIEELKIYPYINQIKNIADIMSSKLKIFGFSDKVLTSISKNEKLLDAIQNIHNVIQSNYPDDNSLDISKYNNILYSLVKRYNNLTNKESVPIIVKYILDDKIDTEKRLSEAIKYITFNEYNEDLFHKSFGFGITYTDEQITNEIKKTINNKDKWGWSK